MLFKSKKYICAVAVFWGAAVVALVSCYMLVVQPRRIAAKNIETQFSEKQQQLRIAQQSAEEQNKTQKTKRLQSWQEKLSEFVIDDGEAAGLIFEISQIANNIGVTQF